MRNPALNLNSNKISKYFKPKSKVLNTSKPISIVQHEVSKIEMGNLVGTIISGTLNPGVPLSDSSHAQMNNFDLLSRPTQKQAHKAGDSSSKFGNSSVRAQISKINDQDLTRELNIGEYCLR